MLRGLRHKGILENWKSLEKSSTEKEAKRKHIRGFEMMDFETWVELIWIDKSIPLRTPGSKHQRKIKEILEKIQAAKDNPTDENIQAIYDIDHIDCRENYRIIVYCRYLQYAISVLKDEGK